jgi:hypothetical protein
MINMKKKPEVEEMPGSVEMDEPLYPYGLCITLDKEQLDKLGITALPKVGSTMMVHAMAYVKSTSAYETQGGKDMSIQLQITDMKIDEEDRSIDRAEAMYGKDKGTQKETTRINDMSTLLYGGS